MTCFVFISTYLTIPPFGTIYMMGILMYRYFFCVIYIAEIINSYYTTCAKISSQHCFTCPF